MCWENLLFCWRRLIFWTCCLKMEIRSFSCLTSKSPTDIFKHYSWKKLLLAKENNWPKLFKVSYRHGYLYSIWLATIVEYDTHKKHESLTQICLWVTRLMIGWRLSWWVVRTQWRCGVIATCQKHPHCHVNPHYIFQLTFFRFSPITIFGSNLVLLIFVRLQHPRQNLQFALHNHLNDLHNFIT